MTYYSIIAALYTLICLSGFVLMEKVKADKETFNPTRILVIVSLIAFAIRFAFALRPACYRYDIECFKLWANSTVSLGLNGMYHTDMFLDYPPGYMYVLYAIKLVQSFLGIAEESRIYLLMLKAPAIFADIATAFFIYKIASKKLDKKWGLFLFTCFAFNPAYIYNSGIWGQIDSYYTLLVVLAIYFAAEDDVIKAAFVYAIALLTKPQSLLFGPVLLFWILEKKDIKAFFKAVGTGLGTIWVLALPFSKGLSPLWLIDLYTNTFGGYKYFTLNGCNFYMLLGLNERRLSDVVGSGLINIVVIGLCFAFCAWGFFCQKNKGKFFETSLVFITVFFTFCTMMHERYMYPAMLLAMVTFVYTKKDRMFYLFLWSTALCYLNVSAVFATSMLEVPITQFFYKTVSLGTVLFAVACIWFFIKDSLNEKSFKFNTKQRNFAMLLALCVIYGTVAFFRLGSTTAPQNFYQTNSDGEWFVLRFDEPQNVREVYSYSALGDEYSPGVSNSVKSKCNFDVLIPGEDGLWQQIVEISHDYVFTWNRRETNFITDSVMVRSLGENQVLGEIVFKNEDGKIIRGTMETGIDPNTPYGPYNALDESHTCPDTMDDYYWSMYFDEIYHGRTAYEQLKGYTIYETTHPPLGKIIISLGIAIFGMTPFGWRVMGALRGVLMVVIMYFIGKELFGKFTPAYICAVIFAFDFMHFTQTRIATVDSYVVLFVMLMFLFMLKYAKIPLDENKTTQLMNLLLSGIFMGCAVAVKWNGAYSVIGLAIVFFVALAVKYKKYIDLNPENKKSAQKQVFNTCLFCVLFFVVIPFLIYFSCYIPVIQASGAKNTIAEFFGYQKHMLSYHSELVAEHFFASPWYTWPFMIKPIWYSVARRGAMASSISAFGNLLVWPLMPFALIYVIGKTVRKKDFSGLVIIAGYFASFLPWALITRLTFIYHYFPATVFGVLAIGYCIKDLLIKKPKLKKYIWIYPALVVICFVVFFPVLSGYPVNGSYIDALELLSTWYFN